MPSSYGLEESGSNAVLFCVLFAFTLLALLATGKIPLPAILKNILVPLNQSKSTSMSGTSSEDFFLSARSSADARTIAMSFFASGMGAWVVYGTTEMGATPALSWLGVIGYSGASAIPAVIICVIGPHVKKISGAHAFSTTDFAMTRYGRVSQLLVAGVSIFYMFIFLVSELTSISNIFGLMNDVDIYDDATTDYTTPVAITVCCLTVFYTAFGGVPASIVTDKFQGLLVCLLVIILTIAVTTQEENKCTAKKFDRVSQWTDDGFFAMVSLIIAIASAEMFHQGNWQRVWAAKDEASLRTGFLMGSVMVFFLMMFFGLMGMLAVAKDYDAYANWEKFAYLSFFDLLLPLPAGLNYAVLVLITALCASSVDTLQNGIVSVFSHDILSTPRLSQSCCMCARETVSYGSLLTRVLLVAVNIPAVIMSAQRYDVLSLFLVADLVCATSVLPIFLGLITKPKLYGLIQPPTELGCVLGCLCGVSAVLVNGSILGFEEAVNGITGETLGTGPFSYFWLTNGDICALCGTKTMVTFIATPLAGGLGCIIFSNLDMLIRGDAAKMPLLEALGFSNDHEAAEDKEDTKCELATLESHEI